VAADDRADRSLRASIFLFVADRLELERSFRDDCRSIFAMMVLRMFRPRRRAVRQTARFVLLGCGCRLARNPRRMKLATGLVRTEGE
jgi:hypothetical protein